MLNKHIAILGPTGSGKSYMVKKALRAGKFGARLIIVDIQDEYPGEEISLLEVLEQDELPPYFYWRMVPENEDEVDRIFRLAMALENVWVIAEEVADYGRSPELLRTLRRGRRRGVNVVSVSQRPADVPRSVTANSALVVLFHLEEPADLEYVRKRVGKAGEEEVRGLDTFEVALYGQEELFSYLQ